MIQFLILIAAAMFTTMAMDAIWLGTVMSNFYKTELGAMLRFKTSGGMDPIIWSALIVYLLIPLGVILFVLPRVDSSRWVMSSLTWGFAFGIVVYGIYDFTNYSLMKDYPLSIALIDCVWGGVLAAVVSCVTAWIQTFQK